MTFRRVRLASGVFAPVLLVLAVTECASPGARGTTRIEPAFDSVAVGYGQSARRDLTGAVASIEGDSTQRYSPRTVADMIDGRFAGVEVLRRSDGTFSVRIRGQRSILANQEPLYVLDGVPLSVSVGLLRDLNPRDVQRIEVLKGAAATVYGSRGANGVILISLRRAGH